MTLKAYAELYECEWRPTKREMRLWEFAERYTTRCETYDRSVCTGPIKHGAIMPATHRELTQINQNASKVRKEIFAEAEREGITWQELTDTINRWEIKTPPKY